MAPRCGRSTWSLDGHASMRFATSVLLAFETAALFIFFGAARHADSFLPERGGNGDATAIAFWNTIAGVTCYALLGLFLTASALTWFQRVPRHVPASVWFRSSLRGAQGLAATLPVFGLGACYLILFG